MKGTKEYNEMFEVFAELHPVEAYDLNRTKFYHYMKKKCPVLSRKSIDKIMLEVKNEIDATT